MMNYLIAIIVYVVAYVSLGDAKHSERDNLLQTEARIALGGNISLTDKEELVNKCLMQYKFKEIDYGFDNPEYFNFSQHFFHYKDNIHTSKVYRIIKDMPKGAALHIHDMGILGPDYLLNLTYMDHLYFCPKKDSIEFIFANDLPNTACPKWQLVAKGRSLSKNVKEFDARLRKHFTLVVDDPAKAYPNINDSWKAFMEYFKTVAPLVTYRPVWEQYFYDVLKEFRDHNVMYVEVRSVLPNLYELDGTVYEPLVTAKAYKKVIRKFVKDYPDFVGAKLIYAPPRHVSVPVLKEYLNLAYKIKEDMPNYFAGFDLVGQEDIGKPLIDFLPELTNASKRLDFFFHAGETDWSGCLTDENLVDAILLGAKRIGHAYALLKHPVLMGEVFKKDIGLEVNVISNTVLSLVQDVRNHPVNVFLAHGLPVVISSDDPGAWEADVLSSDFYVVFVGAASKHSDLRLLKTLAQNSLKYSALKSDEKIRAFEGFDDRWNKFVDNFDCSKY